jgi:hypothetical protein
MLVPPPIQEVLGIGSDFEVEVLNNCKYWK